jgi:hypothetical protein
MRHELEHPPRTIMEVFKMLPEGTLAELIEGTSLCHHHQQLSINP